MSSGTRAHAAYHATRAKERLIQALFRAQDRKAQDAFQKYTYPQLRQAYLETIQVIHPDKNRHVAKDSSAADDKGRYFVEVQDAWDAYQKSALKEEGSFTMFGVGCSFADSPEERRARHEIMEQASRGWFRSGLLSSQGEESQNSTGEQSSISLCSQDMFVSKKDDYESKASENSSNRSPSSSPPSRSLVDMRALPNVAKSRRAPLDKIKQT